MSLRYRMQVDYKPFRIAIFKPDEMHLPDEQKTYFSEVVFGPPGQPDVVMLTADDLIVDETGRIGVDLSRIGPLPPGTRFGVTSGELKRFKQRYDRP